MKTFGYRIAITSWIPLLIAADLFITICLIGLIIMGIQLIRGIKD